MRLIPFLRAWGYAAIWLTLSWLAHRDLQRARRLVQRAERRSEAASRFGVNRAGRS